MRRHPTDIVDEGPENTSPHLKRSTKAPCPSPEPSAPVDGLLKQGLGRSDLFRREHFHLADAKKTAGDAGSFTTAVVASADLRSVCDLATQIRTEDACVPHQTLVDFSRAIRRAHRCSGILLGELGRHRRRPPWDLPGSNRDLTRGNRRL
jgi:hypothetical protein